MSSSGFDLGNIQPSKKKPGTFTDADREAMSSNLDKLGLNCEANTPEKMKQYIDQVSKSLPSSTLGSKIFTASSSVDTDYTIDAQNPIYKKMLVIAQNLEKVDKEHLYITKKHHESSNFESTTSDSLVNVFSRFASVLSSVSGGNVDAGQVLSAMRNQLKTLRGNVTGKDLTVKQSGVWFGFAEGQARSSTYPGVSAVAYTYTLVIYDYQNKKKHSTPWHHRKEASYTLDKQSIFFASEDFVNQIYEKVKS